VRIFAAAPGGGHARVLGVAGLGSSVERWGQPASPHFRPQPRQLQLCVPCLESIRTALCGARQPVHPRNGVAAQRGQRCLEGPSPPNLSSRHISGGDGGRHQLATAQESPPQHRLALVFVFLVGLGPFRWGFDESVAITTGSDRGRSGRKRVRSDWSSGDNHSIVAQRVSIDKSRSLLHPTSLVVVQRVA